MFWELLEAIIKCMIVFQVLNFDSETEILKIRCRFYILMKIVIILRKIHLKMKSCLSCRFITYSIRIGDFDWCECQKQPL